MKEVTHSKKYMVKETGDFPPESIVFTDSHRYLLVFDLRAKFLSRQEKNARLAPWTRRRALGRGIRS